MEPRMGGRFHLRKGCGGREEWGGAGDLGVKRRPT